MLIKRWYPDVGMIEKKGNKTKQYGISPPQMVLISSVEFCSWYGIPGENSRVKCA